MDQDLDALERQAMEVMRKLVLRKTPDLPPKSRRGQSPHKGANTQLSIRAFMVAIFRANEVLPKNRKMTDAEIHRQLNVEFPKRHYRQDGRKGIRHVSAYRGKFNRGVLTYGVLPKKRSYRYTELGEVADPFSGKPLLEAFSEELQGLPIRELRRRVRRRKLKEMKETGVFTI